MYSEIFYEKRTSFKKNFWVILIAYLIVMIIVPIVLSVFKVALVYPRDNAWDYIGNCNLAFLIMSIIEFIVGIIIGGKFINPYLYYVIMLLSFFIKLLFYFLISAILWFFNFFAFVSLSNYIDILMYRFVMSFNAFGGILFIPTMLCAATFFGIQIGLLIKNKKRTKEIEEMLNASNNR